MADSGMGTIFSHSSGWFAECTGVDWDSISRAMYDATHLTTPVYTGTVVIRRKQPSDIVDIGALRVRMFWKPDVTQPIFGAPETISLTSPVPPGKSVGAIITGEACVTDQSAAIMMDGLMTAEATLEFTGESFTHTPSA